jgi:lambda family phage portal protein
MSWLGRIIDRCVEPFAPGRALRRLESRRRYHALSTYEGAERNRTNRDWNPKNVSADAAILGDFTTLLPRARAISRDTWQGESLVGAFRRNVIGRGITPNAVAKDPSGKERTKENEKAETLFTHWASRKEYCDVEGKQTFWRKQGMAVSEMVAVGEHFIVWSYSPNPLSVGLKLQSFEPEQLDVVKVKNTATGNEIRRGIEVDDKGKAVAYWFYKRPLNDYFGFVPSGVSGGQWNDSERIPAERVRHLFEQRRPRQTHGITRFASVIKKIRDSHTCDDANLWSMKMEACVGGVVTTKDGGAGFRTGLPDRDGDSVSKDNGPQFEFEPGMLPILGPDEKFEPFTPSRPGGTYQPYMESQDRAIAAGAGTSAELMRRDFTKGTYSSQRQGMLEDRREFRQIQDLVIDDLCQPVWELFLYFAWLEGKLQMDGYELDPMPWNEVEWVPDGFEWIDPAKEALASSVALDKRLKTRKEIIGGAGGNWRRTFRQLADEQAFADTVGITLPDSEPTPPSNAGDAPDQPKPKILKPSQHSSAFVETVTSNSCPSDRFRKKLMRKAIHLLAAAGPIALAASDDAPLMLMQPDAFAAGGFQIDKDAGTIKAYR